MQLTEAGRHTHLKGAQFSPADETCQAIFNIYSRLKRLEPFKASFSFSCKCSFVLFCFLAETTLFSVPAVPVSGEHETEEGGRTTRGGIIKKKKKGKKKKRRKKKKKKKKKKKQE